jgi:AP-1 complex subunit beta-1
VVIAKDIFRKFSNKYEKLIKSLCEKLADYSEPHSKASILWIIGEYAEKIDNSENLIEQFIEEFLTEPDNVK